MTTTQGPWLKSKALEERLPLSRRTLLRYVDKGWLEPGTHFLVVPGKATQYLWNVEAIERRLAELTRVQVQPTAAAEA